MSRIIFANWALESTGVHAVTINTHARIHAYEFFVHLTEVGEIISDLNNYFLRRYLNPPTLKVNRISIISFCSKLRVNEIKSSRTISDAFFSLHLKVSLKRCVDICSIRRVYPLFYVTATWISYETNLAPNISLVAVENDLVDKIWKSWRLQKPNNPLIVHNLQFTGKLRKLTTIFCSSWSKAERKTRRTINHLGLTFLIQLCDWSCWKACSNLGSVRQYNSIFSPSRTVEALRSKMYSRR